jgi:hypothetical protein
MKEPDFRIRIKQKCWFGPSGPFLSSFLKFLSDLGFMHYTVTFFINNHCKSNT